MKNQAGPEPGKGWGLFVLVAHGGGVTGLQKGKAAKGYWSENLDQGPLGILEVLSVKDLLVGVMSFSTWPLSFSF